MRAVRWKRVAAAMFAGVVVMSAPLATAGAQTEDGAQAEEPSAITINRTPLETDQPCTPGSLGLTRAVHNDADSFTLTVRSSAAPCSPIEAKAVVYAMPAGGGQWPQTLVEVVPFTISEAGITEIVFEKGCDPVQFDVLTGETPQQIAPTGPWHGPLLFPLDIDTSYQHFGNPECNTTTTTTTSTTMPEVLASTTVPVTSTTAAVEVAAETTVPVDNTEVATTEAEPANLALTGSSSRTGVALGLSSLLVGAVLLLVARRRNTAQA